MIPSLTLTQWGGVALIAAGLLWWLAPQAISRVRALLPVTRPSVGDSLSTRMDRLAQVQADLEDRGHDDEAEMAGSWYAMLRDPIKEDKP